MHGGVEGVCSLGSRLTCVSLIFLSVNGLSETWKHSQGRHERHRRAENATLGISTLMQDMQKNQPLHQP